MSTSRGAPRPSSKVGASRLSFFHYDFYAQALAKIERGEVKDLTDVGEMLRRGLVDPGKAWHFYEQIEAKLYRYPDIDPASFRLAVEESLGPEPKDR